MFLGILLMAGCASGPSYKVPPFEGFGKLNGINQAPEPIYTNEGSLWQDYSRSADLFADNKARYVNDILTIVIVEGASAKNDANTSLSRDNDLSADVSAAFGGITRFRSKNPNVPSDELLGAKFGSSFDSKGSTSRSNNLTANMTAIVKEVLPNGNLYVEGKREVVVNNEEQFIFINGIVRPEDIRADNSVLSTSISDARIIYSGTGIISEKQKPGVGERIIHTIWPF